jgi:hypothetical protein
MTSADAPSMMMPLCFDSRLYMANSGINSLSAES